MLPFAEDRPKAFRDISILNDSKFATAFNGHTRNQAPSVADGLK
jgi:hypothetical protein